MITHYEKFRILDENKQNEFFMEVNWNPKDPKSNECKMVKVTFPNGDECVVKKEHLHAMLFVIGNPDEQMKMVPQRIGKVRELEGWFKVKATKPIAKGEEVVFPYKIGVPMGDSDVIGDLSRLKKDPTVKRLR